MIAVPTNTRFQNLTGRRFGRLCVLRYAGRQSEKSCWNCRCDCGTERLVRGTHLTGDKIVSCGQSCCKGGAPDFRGERFGRLLVVGPAKPKRCGRQNAAQWLCHCDCGKEVVVLANSIKRGSPRSCGCDRREDLLGKRFGRLTVISEAETKQYQHRRYYYWNCICDCGIETVVARDHLKSGHTISCGCYGRELQRKLHTTHGLSGTSAYRRQRTNNRNGKKQMLDDWSPSMQEAIYEQQPECVLCDAAEDLTVDHVRPLSRGHGLYPGNAVVLCRSCNSTKHDKHPDDLPTETRTKLLKAAKAFETYWRG